MSMSDTIADMLTRIRNGQKSKLITVQLMASKMKIAILDVLKNEGYIKGYNVASEGNKKYLEVLLKYSTKGEPAIIEVHRVSKPSKRVYSQLDKLKGFYNNMGIYILTTSKGIISDRQAHNLGIGGEVICRVF